MQAEKNVIKWSIPDMETKEKTIIKWDIPSKPSVGRKREKSVINTVSSIKEGKSIYAKSSLMVGLGSLTLLTANQINVNDGLFWSMFEIYLYPWFLDVARVFVAIKIAQGFYEENRGGRDSGTGLNAIFTYGKWLLFFHMIPFFVRLLDEMGTRMASHLG